MKSNIGLVFVVNSEKAFGRFVKEFAGEEEIGRVGGHFQPTASGSGRSEVLKSVGEANS